MKKVSIFWIFLTLVLFWEIIFKGFVAIPADTLLGANLPWRDYKWGYATGVPVKNPPISDVFSQLFVWKSLQADALKAGYFPLWNRYSFSGTPLLAGFQTSVLFPINIIFLLLPLFWAWNLHIVLSTLTAALFMAWYLRFHFRSVASVIVGSLIFAFSGPMTTWSEFGTAVWAMSAFPLGLLAIDLIVQRFRPLYLWVLSAATFLVITAGNVQIATYYCVLLSAYAYFVYNPKLFLRLIPWLILGAGLAAIQLLPTYNFNSDSIRELEQYSREFNFGLSSPMEIVRFWAPDFFGHPATYNHWGTRLYHEQSSFLGTLGAVLVLASFILPRKNRRDKFFTFVFLTVLILAFANPLSQWLFSRQIPLITYSSASRLFFVTVLSGAILAASVLSRYLSSGFTRSFLTSTVILLLATFGLYQLVPDQFSPVSLRNSLLPVGIIIGSGLILIFRHGKKFFPLMIIAILIFDFGRYFRKYNPFISPDLVFPSTPVLDYLQRENRDYRFINETDEIIPPNTWIYYGLESPEGYDPLHSLAYHRFAKIVDSKDYYSRPTRYLNFTDPDPRYLDLLGVRHFVSKINPNGYQTPALQKIISAGWDLSFTDRSVSVYTNPNALPRAFSVQEIIQVDSEDKLAAILMSPDFLPASQAVILHSPSRNWPQHTSAVIHSIRTRPNGLDISYTATSSAVILVSQGFDPGWVAKVSSTQVPVYRANGGLLAVEVISGSKILLQIRYRPTDVLIGSVISALSLILLAVIGKMKPWIRR